MREVPPSAVSDFTAFSSLPYSVQSSQCLSDNKFGQVSKDGTWAWVVHGCVVEIFSVETHKRRGVWCFGAASKTPSTVITAVVELNSPHLPFPCLLIGLESQQSGGILCIFNVKTSKVIKVIELPYKVTSLEIVCSIGGAVVDTHTLHDHLRCMFGIAAVGTEGGQILLIDLCLDTDNYSNELVPNGVEIINKRFKHVSAEREQALDNDQHLCLLLNENSVRHNKFSYQDRHSLSTSFDAGDVLVSSMKYVHSLSALFVGFNFGGIQLWNLYQLSLQCTFQFHVSQQPLVHFAFQEPENDPKAVVYLWAIRGHYQGENYRPENISTATLYSLTYARKNWIPQYGHYYEGFQNYAKCFEYALSNDPCSHTIHSSSQCSRLIACVIPQSDVLCKLDDSVQHEDLTNLEDLSLCVIAWENWPVVGDEPLSSFLALFDINQWYQAQMPSYLRCNSRKLCSYLGIFSLKEIFSKMNKESLLAISVLPNSLSKFSYSFIAEQFFYPSSLSFGIVCLSSGGLLKASYSGSQRQLLSEMDVVGPECLINPKELYSCCLMSGLLNSAYENESGSLGSVVYQREALLNLALENRMTDFLNNCIQQWKKNELLHSGYSCKFLLEWAWKKVTQIKLSIDKICQPLFNCSGQGLEEDSLVKLNVYRTQLCHLSDMIATFQNFGGLRTEQGQQDLQLRKEVIDSISVYLLVLRWLCDSNLLPEHAEGEEYGEDDVAYPYSLFSKTYSIRRSELQKLHSSISETEILLVDGLVKDFDESLLAMWKSKGGNGLYPPPSIYAAVSTYLIDDVMLAKKHMLMYYLVLDMVAYLSERRMHLLEKLMLFCTSVGLSTSLGKLTQAFWHLDHQDFENAIVSLLNREIQNSDITSWQHVRILKSFLYQGEHQKALHYLQVRKPPEDIAEEIKLHLSVLLTNGLTAEASLYQRQNQSEDNCEDMLSHLFLGSQQTHSLDALLHLPMNNMENSALTNFLNNSLEPRAQELLVVWHLLQRNPFEAANLNEKLSTQIMERNLRSRERAVARNALVNGYLDILPDENRKLAQEINQIPSHVTRNEVAPQPLSSSITRKSLVNISYADMLSSIINKVSDVSREESNLQTPLRTCSKSSVEAYPFVSPLITPQNRTRKRPSDVVFATPVSKRPATSTSDFMSPLKKSRIENNTTFVLPSSERRRSSKHMAGDVLSLLQTPPICRRSKVINIIESTSDIAPHSILKSNTYTLKKLSQATCSSVPSTSSEISKGHETSDDEEMYSNAQESESSKQLRFCIPSPASSPDLEKAPNTTQNLSSIASIRSYQVSPRQPLHKEIHQELPSVDTATAVDISDKSTEDDVFLSDTSQDYIVDKEPEIITIKDSTENEHSQPRQTSDVCNYTFSVPESFLNNECVPNFQSTVKPPDEMADVSAEEVEKDQHMKDVQLDKEQYLQTNLFEKIEDLEEDHLQSEPIVSSALLISDLNSNLQQSHSSIFYNEMISELLEEPMVQEFSHNVDDKKISDTDEDKLLSQQRESICDEDKNEKAVTPSVTVPKDDIEPEINGPYINTRSRSRSRSLSKSPCRRKGSKKLSNDHDFSDELRTPNNSTTEEKLSYSGKIIENLESAKITLRNALSPIASASEDEEAFCLAQEELPYENHMPDSKVAKTPEKAEFLDDQSVRKTSRDQSIKNTMYTEILPKVKAEEDALCKLPSPIAVISEDEKDLSSYCEKVHHRSSVSSKKSSKILKQKLSVNTEISSGFQKQDVLNSSPINPEEISMLTTESPKVTNAKPKIKKKKKTVNTTRKLEFSFSEPNIMADSEVLEALSSPQEHPPIASFVFSPPTTRAKARQKQLNDTMNSSVASSVFESSYSYVRRTRRDPLLEDSFAEQSSVSLKNTSSQSTKNDVKKKRTFKVPAFSVSESVLNLISPFPDTEATPANPNSRRLTSQHSMVLRKSRVKRKSVKLF